MNAYLLGHIQDRRANPGDDLTSKLVTAEVDGEALADEEIVGFVALLLLAGHITTTAAAGQHRAELRGGPRAAAGGARGPELAAGRASRRCCGTARRWSRAPRHPPEAELGGGTCPPNMP